MTVWRRVLGYYGEWEIVGYGYMSLISAYSPEHWMDLRLESGRWRHPTGDARPPGVTPQDVEAMIALARLFGGTDAET